jgi:ABC-type uncharacterized transport system permease subunit
LSTALILVALLGYALACSLLLKRLRAAARGESSSTRDWRWAFALGVVAHGASLLILNGQLGGMSFSFFPTLSLVGWVMAAIVLGLSARSSVGDLALLLLPLLAATLALVLIQPEPRRPPEQLSWQIALHAFVALAAYGALALAALKALLLALNDNLLKRPARLKWVQALPPLSASEALLFQLIAVGFGLLSLTLLSGVLFVENLFAQHLAHKTVLSLIAWVVFGVLLIGRHRHGWRGRQALRWTLLGMSLLALAFLGSKFVLELLLQRV